MGYLNFEATGWHKSDIDPGRWRSFWWDHVSDDALQSIIDLHPIEVHRLTFRRCHTLPDGGRTGDSTYWARDNRTCEDWSDIESSWQHARTGGPPGVWRLDMLRDDWSMVGETPHFWWFVLYKDDILSEIARHPKHTHLTDVMSEGHLDLNLRATLDSNQLTEDEWYQWVDDDRHGGFHDGPSVPTRSVTFDPPRLREIVVSPWKDGSNPVTAEDPDSDLERLFK